MLFVIINGRIPMSGPQHCACCCEKLDSGYIHDLNTDLKYCDLTCFKFSTTVAQEQLLLTAARSVS